MEDTPEARMMLGARIQQARLAVGFDVKAEFCRRVGVQAPTLHRWEHGQNVPDAFNLYEIARACRVSMEWLVTGESAANTKALQAWLETPTGREASKSPEAMAFVQGLPLLGYQPSVLFYDLAYVAYQNGLSREEAARAAKATEVRH